MFMRIHLLSLVFIRFHRRSYGFTEVHVIIHVQDTDAILDMLNMTSIEYRGWFKTTRWTCVGSVFSQIVEAAYQAKLEDEPMDLSMFSVVVGLSKQWTSKVWSAVDRVFGVELIADCHWVAYEYDLRNKVINLYDSVRNRLIRERREAFAKHAAMAPMFYNISHPDALDRVDEDQTWPIVLRWSPQQDNAHDCGVYSLKVIQCLAWGDPPMDLDQRKFADYRKKLAQDLVKWRRFGKIGFVEMDI
jgi:hypothetical protein